MGKSSMAIGGGGKKPKLGKGKVSLKGDMHGGNKKGVGKTIK